MNKANIIFEKFDPVDMFYSKEECVHEFKNKEKTSIRKELKNSLWYRTNWIPDLAINKRVESYQRFYHLNNNMTNIPVCQYTNEYQTFDKNGYSGYSKTILKFKHKLDKAKYANWITIEYLFSELTLYKIEELLYNVGTNNFFFIFRQNFPWKMLDKEKIFEKLIELEYEPLIAKQKTNNITGPKSLISFISWFVDSKKYKNTSIEYFLERGWPQDIAKDKLKNFFQKGVDSISKKRKEDHEYDMAFRKSRLSGFLANKHRSKLEIDICNKLSKKYVVESSYKVKMPNRYYVIDIKIENSILVEINGSYWHKDVLGTDPNFKKYVKEILKAKSIIDHTGLKYMLVWEFDLHKNNASIINIIEDALNSSKKFFSTRKFDELLFNENNLKKIIE
jgi:hypothetical protein